MRTLTVYPIHEVEGAINTCRLSQGTVFTTVQTQEVGA